MSLYDSKNFSTKIPKMNERVTARDVSIQKDISPYIDQLSEFMEQINNLSTALPTELTVALLNASIEIPELSADKAAVSTLIDGILTRDGVAT